MLRPCPHPGIILTPAMEVRMRAPMNMVVAVRLRGLVIAVHLLKKVYKISTSPRGSCISEAFSVLL